MSTELHSNVPLIAATANPPGSSIDSAIRSGTNQHIKHHSEQEIGKNHGAHNVSDPLVEGLVQPSGSGPWNLDEYSEFWDTYLKEAEDRDKEMLVGWNSDLDTILIFAGLFSAVNTAFIVESYANLKPDPADSTNALLRVLINRVDNTTFSDIEIRDLESFAYPPGSIRTNSLFFGSLSSSLLAAFGAVLAKQWLNQYSRVASARTPREKVRTRQRRFNGMMGWKFQPVIEFLPVLLQLSLLLFFVALIDFLWTISRQVSGVVIGLSAFAVVFYAFTTITSAIYPDSPFQTPVSLSIRRIIIAISVSARIIYDMVCQYLPTTFLHPPPASQTEKQASTTSEKSSTDMIDAQSVAWLFQTVNEPKDVLVASRAIRFLRSPTIHPFFSHQDTISALAISFSSCFLEQRLDRDGRTIVIPNRSLDERASAAGHALCRILSAASPTPQVTRAILSYSDALPDDISFELKNTGGVAIADGYYLAPLISFLCEPDFGWSYRVLMPAVNSMTSQWDYFLNCLCDHPLLTSDDQRSVTLCCKRTLASRPLPPIEILSTIFMTLVIGLGGTVKKSDALLIDKRGLFESSIIQCLEILTSEPNYFSTGAPLNAKHEAMTLKVVLEVLLTLEQTEIAVRGHHAIRYLACLQSITSAAWSNRERVQEQNTIRHHALRLICSYAFERRPGDSSDSVVRADFFFNLLNACGEECSKVPNQDEREYWLLEDDGHSSLNLCITGLARRRDIWDTTHLVSYPHVPYALAHAIGHTASLPTSELMPPLVLLSLMTTPWFRHKREDIHNSFIGAEFSKQLCSVLNQSAALHDEGSLSCKDKSALCYYTKIPIQVIEAAIESKIDLWIQPLLNAGIAQTLQNIKCKSIADSKRQRILLRLFLASAPEIGSELFFKHPMADMMTMTDVWRTQRRSIFVTRNGSTGIDPEAWSADAIDSEVFDAALVYFYLAMTRGIFSKFDEDFVEAFRSYGDEEMEDFEPDMRLIFDAIQSDIEKPGNRPGMEAMNEALGLQVWMRVREVMLTNAARSARSLLEKKDGDND